MIFGTVLEKEQIGIQLFTKNSIIMKTMMKATAALAGLLIMQTADAQLGVRATTTTATRATVNATRATTAASNAAVRATAATGKVTAATVNATRATTAATIGSVNRVKSNTDVNANVGAKASTQAELNSNAGGEERGLVRASSRSEAELNANANAKLPLREGAEMVGEQKDMAKEKAVDAKTKAEAAKEAGMNKAAEAKTKAKEVKPSVSASGEVKAKGSAKAGS